MCDAISAVVGILGAFSTMTQMQAIDAQAAHQNAVADATLASGRRSAEFAKAKGRVEAQRVRRKGDAVKATQRVGFAAAGVSGATVDDVAYTTEMDIRTDERLALQGAAIEADDILNRAAVGAFAQRPYGAGLQKQAALIGGVSSTLGAVTSARYYGARPSNPWSSGGGISGTVSG